MKDLKTGSGKIQEICDLLKKEGLEPAQKESAQILKLAEDQAASIKQQAEIEAKFIIESAKQHNDKERLLFLSSLSQASLQAKEKLRQSIIEDLFQNEIGSLVDAQSGNPDLVARLIEALVQALEKEGLDADLAVLIPAHLSSEEVCQKLSAQVVKKLRNNKLELASFKGGIQVRLEEPRLIIDITEGALKELLCNYLKKPEFRDLIFQAG